MIDFDQVHNRYWRDQRANPDAAIPVRGGDFVERDGRRYAVLFDFDGNPVVVYRLAKTRMLAAPEAEAAEVMRTAAAGRR